jgi:plasmid stabilization system protein ParE
MSAPSLSIIITSKADADETAIYNYISETFGSIYADNFRKRLIEVLKLMSRQAFIGRPAKGNALVRVLMMSRQNKIVYKITETEIVVLRILSTRTKLSGEF